MSYNLANYSAEERDKVVADLHASGIAYKERYGMPFHLADIEQQIPLTLRDYFQQRILFYRTNPYKLSKMPYEPKMRKS
ncbi:MAG: DNA polymerase III subunit theta [Enterobacteriaceae bacterium]